MIYTSYFAKLSALTAAGIVPISIALYKPKWYNGYEASILAPNPDLLKRFKIFHDEKAYRDEFRTENLEWLNPYKLVCGLQEMIGNRHEFALICYEKPTSFFAIVISLQNGLMKMEFLVKSGWKNKIQKESI